MPLKAHNTLRRPGLLRQPALAKINRQVRAVHALSAPRQRTPSQHPSAFQHAPEWWTRPPPMCSSPMHHGLSADPFHPQRQLRAFHRAHHRSLLSVRLQ
jgi:hypothetical protein